MSKSIIDGMNAGNAAAMLEYLTEQLEDAETKEDLQAVLEPARQLLQRPPMHQAVHGLAHVRAEYDVPQTDETRGITHYTDADGNKLSNVVNLEVPHILSSTFHALSERMNTLQTHDPDTFANASSALNWLANGEITSNQN